MNRRTVYFLLLIIACLNIPLFHVQAEDEFEDEAWEPRETIVVPASPLPDVPPPAASTNVARTTITAPQEIPAAATINTASLLVAQPNLPSSWPWYITRAFGIASFLLLFTSALVGMLMTTGLMHRLLSPTSSWSLHRTTGVFLILSILLHLAGLLFDRFIDLHIFDILIPFHSPYQPLYVALGIFGLYLFIPVIWTSLVWVDKRSRFWRTTHFLSFPMFVVIFLHGLLLGTDSKQPWMQAIYWATGSIMVLMIIYRVVWKLRAGLANK